MATKKLTITVGEEGQTHSIEGIPEIAWNRFVEAAKKQFPKDGDNAWAAFISEVILATSGGDETVTYFMTDVPRENAQAIHDTLQQIGFTWDRFHAYLLHAAVLQGHVRVVRLNYEDNTAAPLGTVILTNIDPVAFQKIEVAVGKSFEQVMGTMMIAAAQGGVTFAPESTFLEPSAPPAA